MAVRQYVGARYVPKFADPVQWSSTRQYEPLTIVTNLGNSYTSKKPVPAGIDIGNTEYWVNTGNFNEQVRQIQNDIVELNNEVDDINDTIAGLESSTLAGKKIVIYGDSNSDQEASVQSQTLQPNWVTKFIAMNPGAIVTNRSVSGRRVSGSEGIANTIYNASDLETFDYIIIFGGVNDWQHSVDMGNAGSNTVATFIGSLNVINQKINAVNKTAKVFFISPVKTYRTSGQLPSDHNELVKLQLYRIAIKKCCGVYNWNYVEGANAPRLNTSAESIRGVFIVDGLHMNTNYSTTFAEFVTKALLSERDDPVCNVDTLIDVSSLIDTTQWTVTYARLLVDGNGLAKLLIMVQGTFTNAVQLVSMPDPFKPVFAAQGHTAVVVNNVYEVANSSINANGNISVQCAGTHTSALVTCDLTFNLGAFYFSVGGSV